MGTNHLIGIHSFHTREKAREFKRIIGKIYRGMVETEKEFYYGGGSDREWVVRVWFDTKNIENAAIGIMADKLK